MLYLVILGSCMHVLELGKVFAYDASIPIYWVCSEIGKNTESSSWQLIRE
jgi:hypothetical protein